MKSLSSLTFWIKSPKELKKKSMVFTEEKNCHPGHIYTEKVFVLHNIVLVFYRLAFLGIKTSVLDITGCKNGFVFNIQRVKIKGNFRFIPGKCTISI